MAWPRRRRRRRSHDGPARAGGRAGSGRRLPACPSGGREVVGSRPGVRDASAASGVIAHDLISTCAVTGESRGLREAGRRPGPPAPAASVFGSVRSRHPAFTPCGPCRPPAASADGAHDGSTFSFQRRYTFDPCRVTGRAAPASAARRARCGSRLLRRLIHHVQGAAGLPDELLQVPAEGSSPMQVKGIRCARSCRAASTASASGPRTTSGAVGMPSVIRSSSGQRARALWISSMEQDEAVRQRRGPIG